MSYKTDVEINVEGVVLPNVPLTNLQLIDAAKKLKIDKFRGVFVRDELPKKPRTTECGILNLDDSKGNGTHWMAWIKRGNEKFCFDSYGLPPPTELLKYLRGSTLYNSERVQPGDETFCGHLCLYVLKKAMNDGREFQEIVNDLY